SGVPVPLSKEEVEVVKEQISGKTSAPKPKFAFERGESVRVVDGPFNDFNGVVEEVNYEKSRLQVAVTIFGRSTPVELDFDQVEKG
ncbi:MAG: transcription termination/antitermination protein NusG, partial [Gammaproteobacteria bacterium]|nr:transcription termination/antitermination protein NusG [Gammaproteobacteria bacterium]